ncbi:MAG: ATP-binding protein, partial [Patescibacteria group bacterium]
ICRQLKLESSDGKKYETDCANTEGLFRIIQSIPSPKAEPFKRWLAKVGYERKPQIKVKALKLSQKYADNLPKLNADPKLLRMVFQNLLSNSVKYTPEKGKAGIEISLQSSSLRGAVATKQSQGSEIAALPLVARNDKGAILIKVSDTGYGIPKNQQDKIFTKLFRADNVREQDTEGTGLGLYIVKSIIGHSGGKIWFESEENKGTTFYVTLPLAGMKKKEGTKALA